MYLNRRIVGDFSFYYLKRIKPIWARMEISYSHDYRETLRNIFTNCLSFLSTYPKGMASILILTEHLILDLVRSRPACQQLHHWILFFCTPHIYLHFINNIYHCSYAIFTSYNIFNFSFSQWFIEARIFFNFCIRQYRLTILFTIPPYIT